MNWDTSGIPRRFPLKALSRRESREAIGSLQRMKAGLNRLIGHTMTESKIELTHRLQREDRWDEASKFKDNHIAQLRSEGKPRKEAQQAAWEEMGSEFPPQPSESEPIALEALPSEWAGRLSSSSDDFISDALWVYSRLGLSDVQPEEAPSAGAWSLLRWAKRNEDRFFEQIMPKVVAKSSKTASHLEGELPDEYKQDSTEISRMLADHYLQWEQEAVADTA